MWGDLASAATKHSLPVVPASPFLDIPPSSADTQPGYFPIISRTPIPKHEDLCLKILRSDPLARIALVFQAILVHIPLKGYLRVNSTDTRR